MQLFLIGQIGAEFNSRSQAGKPGRRRLEATDGGIRPICPEVSAIAVLMAQREAANGGKRYGLVRFDAFRRNQLWY
jgi:hypothetical protein